MSRHIFIKLEIIFVLSDNEICKGDVGMVENKKIIAKNIQYYMSVNHVSATDVCKACGFKQNTFSDWVNAKIYPRIDKIEIMASYFNISKADLVEEWQTTDTAKARSIREYYKNQPLELSNIEQIIIEKYRAADYSTQRAVCNILEVKKDIIPSGSSKAVSNE